MKWFTNAIWLTLIFASLCLVGNAALTKIFWSQIDSTTTPTTLTGYGITDAASDLELNAHIASSTDVHGTVGAVVGASGTQTLYGKTLTDTSNHISGTVIDSGTVDEARIDSDIARDSELPLNASFSFTGLNDTPATFTGQGLKSVRVNAGETALEYYTPTAGVSYKRADVVLGVATSTVTFGNDVEGNPVAIGTFGKCKVSINGIAQKYTNFTKTTANVIESTQGDIENGSLVTLEQVD